MNVTTRRKAYIFAGLILITCLAFWWWKWTPGRVEQARKETDAAVSKLEQVIKSQDKTVEQIVTGAKKEVSAKHDKIRESVAALSPDAVAGGLNALLDEYRRERSGGD